MFTDQVDASEELFPYPRICGALPKVDVQNGDVIIPPKISYSSSDPQ